MFESTLGDQGGALRLQRNPDEPRDQDRFVKYLVNVYFVSVGDIHRYL
jgi:hypothetical protein